MVTFECKEENCSQVNIKIDFFGDIKEAECGGCGITLESFDFRDDPEVTQPIFPIIGE